MQNKYKAISLFAGIGGICQGFMNNSVDVIWANDFDKKACETYRLNFPDTVLIEGPIEEIDTSDIPDCDIVTFGFPCTSFSIAGYRKGLEDEHTGHLFFEALRVIKAKKPRAFLLENVKNLVSHDKGKTFKIIKESLEDAGYFLKYDVLNTAEYGNIPQNRERIYVVGFDNKEDYELFKFPDPIELTKTIHDIIDVSDKKEDRYYYNTDSRYYEMLEETMKNKDTVYQLRRVYVRENKSNLCPTLTANMGTGGHNVPLIIDDFGFRKLTPKECLAFQGFPKTFRIPEKMANSHIYKQAGNSVTVTVINRIAKNIVSVLNNNEKINDL